MGSTASNSAEGAIERMVSSKRRVKSNFPGITGPKESREYLRVELDSMMDAIIWGLVLLGKKVYITSLEMG
jgi:hypothetical protein